MVVTLSSRGHRWLRRQPLDDPAAARPAVADPVVQTVRRFLPELDAGRQHPEAAPALRPGNTGSAGVAWWSGFSPGAARTRGGDAAQMVMATFPRACPVAS